MPEKEWPTSTVGPCCIASARCAAATASGSVVSGFCTDVTLSPFGCSLAMTSVQHEPSANRPWTRTMLVAFGVGCAALASWTSGLAALAAIMLTNVRRSTFKSLFYPKAVWFRNASKSGDHRRLNYPMA